MHIRDFVNSRQSDWDEYAGLLDNALTQGVKKMSSVEVDRLLWLYRAMANDLARARTHFPGSDVEKRLNGLVAQGYNLIYHHNKVKTSSFREVLFREFPLAVKRNAAFVGMSFAITIVFCFIGVYLSKIDPRLPYSVVPAGYVDHFESELTENGRVDRDISFKDRSTFSSQLIANNVQVSFTAFSLGIIFGVGTVYILGINGLMMGCLGALFAQHGGMVNYLAFIMPHGVIEISAIIISGGAGLRLGYSLLNPGRKTRAESIKDGAAESLKLVLGVAAMLVVAGIIEAFFTPIMWISDELKLVFSGVFFIIMIGYFIIGARNEEPAPAPEQ